MISSSRRQVSRFVASKLAAGESPKLIAKVLAAYLSANHQNRQYELLLRDIETELLNGYRHLSADVISARALTDETRRSLVNMLKHQTGAETVELDEQVDHSLIGGVVVRTPGAEMDSSLKKKLTRLKAI